MTLELELEATDLEDPEIGIRAAMLVEAGTLIVLFRAEDWSSTKLQQAMTLVMSHRRIRDRKFVTMHELGGTFPGVRTHRIFDLTSLLSRRLEFAHVREVVRQFPSPVPREVFAVDIHPDNLSVTLLDELYEALRVEQDGFLYFTDPEKMTEFVNIGSGLTTNWYARGKRCS